MTCLCVRSVPSTNEGSEGHAVCDECIKLPGREPLEDANPLGHPDSHELSGEAATKLLP